MPTIKIRRLAVTAITIVSAIGLTALLAPLASAATAPHATPVIIRTMATNHSATAVPDSNGFWECDVWTIGSVCVNAESNGYDALYYNSTGASQYVDFNLVTDSGIRVGDQGAFWASPGSTHTYFFATGNRGWPGRTWCRRRSQPGF